MSTTIKYKDDFEGYITEQQASLRSIFSKLFYIDNELKKEEIYMDNSLIGGAYYLDIGENLTDDVLNDIAGRLNWSIMSNKQIINGYTLWEARGYDKNLQPDSQYLKTVDDAKGRWLAGISYDTQTNQILGGVKTFYFGGLHVPDDDDDVFFEDDAEVSFHYNANGEVEKIDMNVDYINNDGTWYELNHFLIDAKNFVSKMMTPAQLEYFSHAEPVVPNF